MHPRNRLTFYLVLRAACWAILASSLWTSTWCTTSVYAQSGNQVVIYAADFGVSEDENKDGWPDNWTRRTDRDHPKYIRMETALRNEVDLGDLQATRRRLAQYYLAWQLKKRPGSIVPEQIPPAIDLFLEHQLMNRCLSITMNGGSAMIESIPFNIDRRFTYEFRSSLRCEKLDGYAAVVSFIAIDSDGNETKLDSTDTMSGTFDWQLVNVSNVSIPDERYVKAKIRLSIRPEALDALNGILHFDDVEVIRLPKLSVNITPVERILRVGENMEISCEITGLDQTDARVSVLLSDVDNHIVHREVCSVVAVTNQGAKDDAATNHPTQYIGACNTNLQVANPGLYTLSVSLIQAERGHERGQTPIVILPANDNAIASRNTRFGMCIEEAGRRLAWNNVVKLAKQMPLTYFKIPVWFDDQIPSEASTLSWALDTMSSQQIKAIAVLDRPPASQLDKFPGSSGNSIASALEYSNLWQPLLQPVWQRVCLHVQEFQLGWDSETMFTPNGKLTTLLNNIKTQMALFGPECTITLPNNILNASAHVESSTVERWQLYAAPGLSATEIQATNESLGSLAAKRWLSLEILPANKYDLDDRVNDVAEKMIAFTQTSFPIGFFSRKSSNYILDRDGRPQEMMLPVRNLSQWLKDAEEFQEVHLVENCRGYMYKSAGKNNLILFQNNGLPNKQLCWLGNEISAEDVWGRPVQLEFDRTEVDTAVHIPDCRWPVIIRNVNDSLIRWQDAVELASPDLISTSRSTGLIKISINNPDPTPVSGEIRIIAPKLLRDEKANAPFAVRAKEQIVIDSAVELRSDVAEGEVPVRLEVVVESPKPYAFSLERTLHVGLPGIKIQSKSNILPNGNLQIDLSLLNSTGDTTSFDMMLFIPDEPRQRIQMLNIKESGARTLYLPNASKYAGKQLRLSCEQIGTGRTINHMIQID